MNKEQELKNYSITYKFLDDPIERKEELLVKRRKRQQEYRKTHRKEIAAKRKIKAEESKRERAKGNRKRWDELTKQEPTLKQIDIRTYKNMSNNNIGQLYTDGTSWWYEIKFSINSEIYTSDKFITRNKAISDLKLAL